MVKIKLITDDSANVPKEFIGKIDYHSMKIPFSINEKEYRISELEPKQFYKMVDESYKTGTSQVNMQEMEDTFVKYLDEGYNIVYISISSGLSGTYDRAINLSQRLLEKYTNQRIIVIDSKGGEGGEGVLVVKAAQLIKKTDDLDFIEKELKYLADHMVYNFIVSDFKLLAKNGRINLLKAVTGSLLKIKPILEISEEGRITSKHKKIGMTKAVSFMMDRMKENIDLSRNDFIYITESFYEKQEGSNSDVVSSFKQMEQKIKNIIGDDKPIYIGDENYIVASHTGPNTIAIFYIKK